LTFFWLFSSLITYGGANNFRFFFQLRYFEGLTNPELSFIFLMIGSSLHWSPMEGQTIFVFFSITLFWRAHQPWTLIHFSYDALVLKKIALKLGFLLFS
jgi:hypothetical protein